MTDLNENNIFRRLDNDRIKEEILSLVKQDNPFLEVFEKTNVVENQWGDKALYYGTQPAPGLEWKRKKSDLKFGEPNVFTHELELVIKNLYYSMANPQIMKFSLGTTERTQNLIAQLIAEIGEAASNDLLSKCVELLCTDDNYRDTALIKKNPADKEFEKPEQVFRWILDTSAGMCFLSKAFNKGYYEKKILPDPADPDKKTSVGWIPVNVSSYKKENLILIIDPQVMNTMVEAIMIRAVNYDLANLEKRFGKVIEVPLVNGYKFIILDKKAFAIRYAIKEGVLTEEEPATMNTWYYSHIWAFAGSIPFANQAAWVERA